MLNSNSCNFKQRNDKYQIELLVWDCNGRNH